MRDIVARFATVRVKAGLRAVRDIQHERYNTPQIITILQN